MAVRDMQDGELPAVLAMMRELWPAAGDYDFSDETVFVWERKEGGLGGFASVSLRPWAEGCDSSPVPYVEGWWVAVDLRGQGVGGRLMRSIEEWARGKGFSEVGSDVELGNAASLDAHVALGFEPTVRLQYFRKRL
jgi:aminoglycoside 6'-N-acetyltransferase I